MLLPEVNANEDIQGIQPVPGVAASAASGREGF